MSPSSEAFQCSYIRARVSEPRVIVLITWSAGALVPTIGGDDTGGPDRRRDAVRAAGEAARLRKTSGGHVVLGRALAVLPLQHRRQRRTCWCRGLGHVM